MSAPMQPRDSADGAPARTQAGISMRAAAMVLGVLVVAFGAAYAIGSKAKKTTTTTPAGQLVRVSAVRGQSSAQIAVPGAAGAIPALAHVAKPKPAHHAKPKPTTQTQAAATVSPTHSTPTQSSASQPVQPQPVQRQPVQQPVQRPVQQPVHHSSPPPVVVVHGG